MAITIQAYSNSDRDKWDSFARQADNAYFLFERGFMEYHSQRYADNSVMLFDNAALVGVFPANRKDDTVYTHQGLTHGGLVLLERKNVKKLIEYFYTLFSYYKNQGVKYIVYKPLPAYLCKTANDIEHFILNLCDSVTTKVDTSFVINYTNEITIQERRRRSIKKGIKAAAEIRLDNNFDEYWNKILIPNLKAKFGVSPVHSLEEIKLLHQRFPNRITQANAYINNEIVAGATLFDFNKCIHSQYISSNDYGRDSGAIDLLFNQLIHMFQSAKEYFSLGTTNNNGKDINIGLCEWKEGWGTNTHAHFHYRLNTENITLLEKFIY
ncbi:MAG: GNAT family N-acetyltransferase [Bacteroidia bacterium]